MTIRLVATSEGSGCIIILLGLLLAPLIIGIFIIIYGMILMSKTEKYWNCRNCGYQIEIQ